MSNQCAVSLYCVEDAVDAVSSDADTWISDFTAPPPRFVLLPEEPTVDLLVDSEIQFMPLPDYLRRCRDHSVDLTARQDSINWILKVHTHYQFRPVTAFLSINYFDRFLSIHSLPQENGWRFQLLSVACLSLAAKMEETYVPLLLDLQVFEPRFVFQPETVQRMELLVMANLNWRLRSVTPFDYLDLFTSKIHHSHGSQSDSFVHVLYTSSDLILKTTRVIDFLGFPPSIIAAAAVISAAGEGFNIPETFYERLNKEMVRSCHQLMEEYLVDTCATADTKDHIAESAPPPSPVGVLEAAACGTCDTRSENLICGSTSGSCNGSSQAEPPNKRVRSSETDVQEQQP